MESEIEFNRLKLESHQERIYTGLKSIGEEISTFYLDSLRILNNKEILAKSYLISHLAREIDGGLRDVFCITDIEREKCKKCGQEIKKETHFEKICIALGVGKGDKLAKKWYSVAKRLHKYAHRSGAWKAPRDISEIDSMWKDFEFVLLKLVGNYYNLLERIDRVLEVSAPNENLLNTLPNLLEVDSRYHYLFKNLKSVEWFNPLYQRGYFSAENLYKKSIAASEYLESVIGGANNFSMYEKEINNIINDVIAFRKNENVGVYTSYIDASMIKLAVKISPKVLNPEINELIERGLKEYGDYSPLSIAVKEKFIPYLLKEKSDNLFRSFLLILLKYETQGSEFGEKYKPILVEFQLEEILDQFKSKMIEIYPQITFEVSLNKIKDLLVQDDNVFNIVWIPTIEDHSQISFPERYICQVIQLLRDVVVELNPLGLYSTISEWLNGGVEILKRLAIYLINRRYNDYKKIFLEFNNNPFDYLYWEHELYELLRDNCLNFNDEDIVKILSWIETENYAVFDDDVQELKNEQIAYQKKKWLSALKGTQNSAIIAKIEYYNKINPTLIKNPGFLIWHGNIERVDYLNKIGDFDKKSIREIITGLNSIDYKDESEELDNRELSLGFEHYIKANSSRFLNDLEKFHEVHPRFKDDLIDGLLMAWKDGKDLDWGKILTFIDIEISQDDFWEISYRGNLNYRNNFIRACCELISSGTVNDQRAFDENYISIAEEILVKIDTNIETDFNKIGDLATSYLNSTKGRFYDAVLNLSLRYARLHNNEKNKWRFKLKMIISNRLDRKQDKTPEFSVLIGGFFSNFLFLDEEWARESINIIFKQDDLEQWHYAMEGHLFFVRHYNPEVYLMLKYNDHIKKVLELGLENSEMNNKICGYVLLAYFGGIENIDDNESEINRLLGAKDEYIIEIIRFIWGEKENPKIIGDKVKPIWKAIYIRLLSNIDNLENQRAIAESTKFLYFFSDIDEEVEKIIIEASKYLYKTFVSVFLLEQFKRLVQVHTAKIGRLYVRILKNNHYPDYKQEDILNIVETLYDQKEKDLADQICNLYAERGYLFLREVYIKNQTL